jgi:hypothetical protein
MPLIKSTFHIFFILFCIVNQGFTQNDDCNCKTDLAFLHEKVKKTPAYKNDKTAYEAFYAQASSLAESLSSGYDCYILLNKVLQGLDDNHSVIYGSDEGAVAEIRDDSLKFNEFKNSALYNIYPRPNIDLDSLRQILISKEISDIEGIYSRVNYMTLGVFKNQNDYNAVVLASENDLWQVGELMYTLVPYGNGYLLNIGGGITSKRLIAYPERIENGLFLTMGFHKDTASTNFSVAMYPESKYVRQEISPEISYIKVGSFNSWYPTLSDAEAFYKSLDGTLTKKNLIIDLRDNGGGGDRNSDNLFKIIKKYIKDNNVYLITNHRTASNAEQFVHKLSEYENCKTFGHRTNGTVAYELKDSNYNLPCGNSIAILTSKKHSAYLAIESRGIEPGVKLDMESDWLEQVVKLIEEKN